MRKGKYSTIRFKNSKRPKKLTRKERAAKRDRMEKLAEYEREKERKPKVKRNGIIIK